MNCAVLMLFGRIKPVFYILYISSQKETETQNAYKKSLVVTNARNELQKRNKKYKKRNRNENG